MVNSYSLIHYIAKLNNYHCMQFYIIYIYYIIIIIHLLFIILWYHKSRTVNFDEDYLVLFYNNLTLYDD